MRGALIRGACLMAGVALVVAIHALPLIIPRHKK